MKYILILFLLCLSSSCVEHNPNKKADELILNRENERNITFNSIPDSLHTVYVPIYSSIYNGSKNEEILLTATLSIRNTSEKDTMYLSRVAYFNTKGDFVRNYLKQPIYLKPLESLEYIIDQNDKTGGSGANFMIDWFSKNPIHPIFHGIMVGGLASRTFSFTSDGLEVN